MTKDSYRKNSCDQNREHSTTSNLCWSDLPVDLSRSVAERLIYPDFLRFRTVCKNWQRAFSDDDDHQRRAVFSFMRIDTSHLFHYTKTQTLCTARFFDLLSPLQVVLPIKDVVQERDQKENQLVHASFCCSYSGWLLLLKSQPDRYNRKRKDCKLLVRNPFRYETLELDLPQSLPQSYVYRVVVVAGFSTNPTCGDCVIFLLWKYDRRVDFANEYEWDEFYITTYHRNWSVFQLRNLNNMEWKFIKDVAYVDGCFYCAVDMESEVVLGALNVALQEWHMMTNTSLRLASRPEHMNLAKSDEGLLLAVCYKEQGDDHEYFYHIYRFDLLRQEWTRVKTKKSGKPSVDLA